jgi:hypothetical protein
MQSHFVLKCPGCGSPAADCVAICPYCGRHTGFAALGLFKGISRKSDGGFAIEDGAYVQLGQGKRECPFCGAQCKASAVRCSFCKAKIVIQRMRIATLTISGGSLTIGQGGGLEIVGRRRRALHKAAAAGDLDVVKREIDEGDDPDFQDKKGQRPLHYAATRGRLEVAQWLVSVGADPDPKDDACKRPIELAQDGEHVAVVTLLQQLGARP